MGAEARCRAVFEGRASEGKALLETAFLLFRGPDLRLQIPFAEMEELKAQDGVLGLVWKGTPVELELGPQAARWMEKIRNPPTLMSKLGVERGMTVALVGLKGFRAELEATGAKISRSPEMVFLEAASRADLARVADVLQQLQEKGGLWIVYPKGRKEITQDDVLRAGRAAGLVDVKVASFSESHTALKFSMRKKS